MFKFLNFRKKYLLYLVPILLLNFYFLTLPLLNTLSYEFSIANGIFLYFINSVFVITIFNKSESFQNKIKSVFSLYFYSIIIPFLLIFFYSVFNFFCSFLEGLLFYFFITLISGFIGISIGILSFTLIQRLRWIIFVLITILFITIPITELFFNPQVYLYTPLIGYFPGVIYDEGISPDFKLIFYRIVNFIFFISLFIVSISYLLNTINRNKYYLGLLFNLFFGILFFVLSPSFGYSTDFNRISKELNGRIESENFIIYHPAEIDSSQMKQILLLHEESFYSLRKFLQVKPRQKIQSFIFKDSEQKKRLFGAGNADVAKPWLYHSYTSLDTYENSIKHELAHIFSAEFGATPFRVASFFNPALIEGIATASSPFYDNNYIHFLSAAAFENNIKFNIPSLFSSLSFLTQTSSLAYIVSGSFSLFLIEKYGIVKFKELYSQLNFNNIYNKNIEALIEEYSEYLKNFSVSQSKNIANYYFGRPSLITNICPRYAAVKLKEGRELLNEKSFDKAEKIFSEIFIKTKSYTSLNGLIFIKEENKDYKSAIKLIEENEKYFEKTVYEFFLKLKKGDLFSLFGNEKNAIDIYKNLLKNSPNIKFTTAVLTRIKLSENNLLIEYLSSELQQKLVVIKKINQKEYYYPSFPLIIELSEYNNISIEEFKKIFKFHFEVNNEIDAYSFLLMSKYFFNKNDIPRSRRTSALAMRFKDEKNFSYVAKENYKVINWIYHNFESVISNSSLYIPENNENEQQHN